MNTQDLIALAKQCGARLVRPWDSDEVVDVQIQPAQLETFCAALVAAQPKADERGSAEPDIDALIGKNVWFQRPEVVAIVKAALATGSEPGLREALEEVVGCFEAAEVEGLPEALHLTRDERLKDLFERRVLFAYEAAKAALAATPERAEPASAEDRKVYEAIADNYFKDTQRAEPQGLTEDEIRAAVGADTAYWATSKTWIVSIARTIESALAARASAGRADK